MSISVFISYAHKDEEYLNDLKTHLAPLLRTNQISLWHDRDITPGAEWNSTIMHQLAAARIILLLISSDFIASDYCYSVEMEEALERHRRREACVIPIILRAVRWNDLPFSHLQALPTDAIPIVSAHWSNQDEALKNVVDGIARATADLPISNPPISDLPHLRPINISPLYNRKNTLFSRIHECHVRFTLTQNHISHYWFEWKPLDLLSFSSSRFMFWLDGAILADRKNVDLRYLDETFSVEGVEGIFLCYHEGKTIRVLIKLGDTVLFEVKDTWNGKKIPPE